MNLSTDYLGLKLDHPIVASASRLFCTPSGIRQLGDAGAAAIFLYSLSLEGRQTPSDLAHYTELVKDAKRAVAVPIVGSLTRTRAAASIEAWAEGAVHIAESGADALELNLRYEPAVGIAETSADIEARYAEIVGAVRQAVSLPIAVRIGPFFSSLPHFASCLLAAGADGLVLFNHVSWPDFDPAIGEFVLAELQPSDATHDLASTLHGLAYLRRAGISAGLGLIGGVQNGMDAVKAVMAGANVVMLASELHRNGTNRLGEVRDEMTRWMDIYGFDSVGEMRGCAGDAVTTEHTPISEIETLRALPNSRRTRDQIAVSSTIA